MAISLQAVPFAETVISRLAVDRIDPLVGDAWDVLVSLRGEHSVFHRSAWAKVLVESYGHRPVYLRVLRDGIEVALVPLMEVRSCLTGRRGVSLPFADFGGPLWDNVELAASVYAVILEVAAERKWKHVEIRGSAVAPEAAQPWQTYAAHHLDLRPGIEAIERGFNPSVRRAIRKAQRSGVVVTIERSEAAVGAFYALHCRTRRRHGLPPQPSGFFRALTRHLIACGLGEVVLARVDDEPVAGAVFLRSGRAAVYKFAASDPEFWALRPNQLVISAAIRFLSELGCEQLHFGRTALSDAGLARFKLSWGCSAETLSYFRYQSRTDTWLTGTRPALESGPLIFRHLPIAINRIAGRIIYPHLD
jgi:CelD/BcsL family acetyltransferase involved in cellulose biosynthesis